MKTYADVLAEKFADYLIQSTSNLVGKVVKPTFNINTVQDIDNTFIDELKSNGIKGIILDIDNTLRTDMNRIPDFNKKWVEDLNKQFKVVVLSNGSDIEVKEYLNSVGIPYFPLSFKPSKRSFNKALNKLELAPEEVMVVGDGIYADIHGGNRLNLTTCKVNSVKQIEKSSKSVSKKDSNNDIFKHYDIDYSVDNSNCKDAFINDQINNKDNYEKDDK